MKSRTKAQSHRVRLRTVGEPEPARRPEPVPVVVELSTDGWVQVFGPKHIRPVIVNRFDDNGPADVRADLATLADLYHELELPRLHRPFYWPVHLLASGRVEHRTPEGERRRQENLSIIRGLLGIRAELLQRQKARAAG